MDFPAEWQKQMARLLGAESDAFFSAMEAQPAIALRLNALRPGAESPRAGARVPWSPNGYYLQDGDAVKTGQDLAHATGVYYMQEASAQAPAEVLAPRPGEVVLDLCAAPGGKASQLAALLCGRGALIANEIDFARAKALSGNLERLGVRNAAVVSESPDRLAVKWPETFDAVLTDAPCSGEGMFRRDTETRSSWTSESPAGCAVRQAKILESAVRMVKPGGRLAYSTCTFNELENEDVIQGFLAAHPDFSPVEFELSGVGRSAGGMLRLWPHRLLGDGHFVALMRRVGELYPSLHRSVGTPPQALLNALPGHWAENLQGWSVIETKGFIDALPPEMPDLSGVRVLRRGLRLCETKGYVKPDHALAMAFPPEYFARAVSLDDVAARAFLGGETIPMDAPDGWTHVSWRSFPLGFGKMSQGILKNHLPKGLRLR
jgi:16S rRNA C967 or C1407 C5-methylase (RsmB/RsmF family)/NOL1/NOP2/fmu family ribosome biogenesis protein